MGRNYIVVSLSVYDIETKDAVESRTLSAIPMAIAQAMTGCHRLQLFDCGNGTNAKIVRLLRPIFFAIHSEFLVLNGQSGVLRPQLVRSQSEARRCS